MFILPTLGLFVFSIQNSSIPNPDIRLREVQRTTFGHSFLSHCHMCGHIYWKWAASDPTLRATDSSWG